VIKSLFLLAFVVSLANAQIDTLKEYLQYYPLQIGDYWEYKDVYGQIPFPSDSLAYSIQVVGDTLLSNGYLYKVLLRKFLYPDLYSSKMFERVDSSTGCVYRFIDDIDTLSINHERKIDSLFARLGDEIVCSREGWSSYGYYKTIFWSMDNDTVFGLPIEKRFLVDQSSIPFVGYAFAKGFGLYSSEAC
jgi:hypothetical protein